MAVLTYKLPLTASNMDGASSAAADWLDPENIKVAGDFLYARPNFSWGSIETLKLLRAHLILDGSIDEANNKAAGETVGSLATLTIGGAADKWGQTTITPAQIRAENFGVVLAYGETLSGVTTLRTRYLAAQNFAFDLPDSCVVDGIEVAIEQQRESLGGGLTQVQVGSIQLRIYYTYTPKIQAEGIGGGFVLSEEYLETQEIARHFRHRVEQDGQFMGEWLDDSIDPSFKEELNNPTSDMMLALARNELTRFPVVDNLFLEDDDDALLEDDDTELLDLAAATGMGEGTDMDLNYDYRLTGYYGRYEPELLENGEILMTEDDEVMLLEQGFPGGRDLFTGYLSFHESDWGESDDLKVHILSHSHELNHIKLESEDTAYIDNSAKGQGDYIGVGSIEGKGDPGLITELWQSFTMAAQKKVSRLSFYGFLQREQTIYFSIRSGTTAGAGTILGSGKLTVTAAMLDDYEEQEIILPLSAAITLPAGSYIIKIISDGWARTNNYGNYPVFFLQNNNVYSGNLTKRAWNTSGTVQAFTSQSPYDLRFKLWEAGGSTSVPMLSMDPTTMFRKVLDFAAARGARVRYDPAMMPPTGTVVSYTFNNMTVRKALDKILELMPADWFYRYDFGSNMMEIGPRPSTVDYTATLGKDIVKLKLRRSIEDLINDVFYTGGGDPSLFVRVTDVTSIDAWRRGLADISDNRVTVEATARLLAQVAIDAKKNPLWSGSITLGADTDLFLEDIRPGMMFGFSGLGAHHDGVQVQLMSRSYNVDTIDGALNTLPPKVLKRIEDIRRNLEQIEQGSAASSPS